MKRASLLNLLVFAILGQAYSKVEEVKALKTIINELGRKQL